MLITNITETKAPKPIGIGNFVLMPGKSEDIPDEVVYVDEVDKNGKKTGKKIILPSIRLMAGLGQLTYEETKKPEKKPAEEKPVVEEAAPEEAPAATPKRGRKKAK